MHSEELDKTNNVSFVLFQKGNNVIVSRDNGKNKTSSACLFF